ncbi:MAG: MFS transporter [Comamonadaceae bacterium BICA1-1]|nr:MAG: MFS transporter [Comamonadaceae bacterium BICA1-1]
MTTPPRKPASPLTEVLIAVIVPSIILMQLSGPEDLGPVNALLLALAFPLGWGARDLWLQRRLNPFAVLGLVSIGLTGGIGLLELDAFWLAVKEAAIPGLIGLAVIGSTWTRYPLIRTVLYHPRLIDVERVQAQLLLRGAQTEFEARLQRATWMLGATFFFSATMNFILARWIVVSPAGSTAFNEELGRLTLLSYPMIAIPATLMMLLVLYYIGRAIHQLTGLKLSECLQTAQ